MLEVVAIGMEVIAIKMLEVVAIRMEVIAIKMLEVVAIRMEVIAIKMLEVVAIRMEVIAIKMLEVVAIRLEAWRLGRLSSGPSELVRNAQHHPAHRPRNATREQHVLHPRAVWNWDRRRTFKRGRGTCGSLIVPPHGRKSDLCFPKMKRKGQRTTVVFYS